MASCLSDAYLDAHARDDLRSGVEDVADFARAAEQLDDLDVELLERVVEVVHVALGHLQDDFDEEGLVRKQVAQHRDVRVLQQQLLEHLYLVLR